MAERTTRFTLVTEDGAPPTITLGIDALKAALAERSAERADLFIDQLRNVTAEAEYLAGLDYLPPGERDRFRRIATLNRAELDGIEALRQQRAWKR